MNKWLIVILLATFLFPACSTSFNEGDFINEVSKKNEDFGIKIRAFRQRAEIGADGVDYQFLTTNLSETDWKEIMTAHHDDGVEMSENNIILINSSVGFAFVSNRYAVTLDKGKSWKALQLNSDDRTCMIKKVEFETNGKGTMTITCNGKIKELETTNFGLELGK